MRRRRHVGGSYERSKLGEGLSNNYCEVIADGLEPGAEYEIAITVPGYNSFTTIVKMDDSINLGIKMLEED